MNWLFKGSSETQQTRELFLRETEDLKSRYQVKEIVLERGWTFIATTTNNYLLVSHAVDSVESYRKAEIPFEDLLGCEISENGITKNTSGVGRAFLGDVLFGPVGAIVGASTQRQKTILRDMSVHILASNIPNRIFTVKINLANPEFGTRDYTLYQQISQSIYNQISAIIKERERMNQPIPQKEEQQDIASKLNTLTQLLNDGLITAEEYQSLREKTLNSLV